jgi:hypothetical protein
MRIGAHTEILKLRRFGPITRAEMHEVDRELRDVMLERQALEFLLLRG